MSPSEAAASAAIDPALVSVLAAHALPNPRDGDCLDTAARVTEALQRLGFTAATAAVVGWNDPAATLTRFAHQVTVCHDLVLDATARQFSHTLPAAWIAPIEEYLRVLAATTGAHHADFWDPAPTTSSYRQPSPGTDDHRAVDPATHLDQPADTNRATDGIGAPAPRPCTTCPYRRDVPSGIWHPDEYDKLRDYDNDTAHQPTAVFQCHQSDATDQRRRLCGGWAGCHGRHLLALRIALSDHASPPTPSAPPSNIAPRHPCSTPATKPPTTA